MRKRTNGPGKVLVDDIDFHHDAILLDVDGTRLDIAPSPLDVVVPHALKDALRTIERATDGATAFVSGRTLADIDRLFEPLKLAAVAGHGAELRLNGRDS